jgi:hypothetical protein
MAAVAGEQLSLAATLQDLNLKLSFSLRNEQRTALKFCRPDTVNKQKHT